MSMCRVFSCVVGRGCVLLAKLYQPLPCFLLYSKAKFACYSRHFLTSYFCIPIPYNEKDIFFGCQFQKVLQVFIEPFNFSFFSITGQGIDLDYHDIEWFALEMNRDHTVVFGAASKYCILDSFVDYDGYSISPKEFLPTLVDIIIICVKFTHSSPFQFTDSQNVDVHSCHLLFDHFQFALIHGPNIPGSYAILLFTASDLLPSPVTSRASSSLARTAILKQVVQFLMNESFYLQKVMWRQWWWFSC